MKEQKKLLQKILRKQLDEVTTSLEILAIINLTNELDKTWNFPKVWKDEFVNDASFAVSKMLI